MTACPTPPKKPRKPRSDAGSPRRRTTDLTAHAHRRDADPLDFAKLHSRLDDHSAVLTELLTWKAEEVKSRIANAEEHKRVMTALGILTRSVEQATRATESNTRAIGELAGVKQDWQNRQGARATLNDLNDWLVALWKPALIAASLAGGVILIAKGFGL